MLACHGEPISGHLIARRRTCWRSRTRTERDAALLSQVRLSAFNDHSSVDRVLVDPNCFQSERKYYISVIHCHLLQVVKQGDFLSQLARFLLQPEEAVIDQLSTTIKNNVDFDLFSANKIVQCFVHVTGKSIRTTSVVNTVDPVRPSITSWYRAQILSQESYYTSH